MPTVARRRRVAAPASAVWALVSEPGRLAEWWPGVTRVEEASPHAWTTVLLSPRGKPVRADYTRAEYEHPRLMAWRQELAESPFERILSESLTRVELAPEGERTTAVELTLKHRGRGFGRFGWLQLRRAARRQAEEALDNLGELVEREAG